MKKDLAAQRKRILEKAGFEDIEYPSGDLKSPPAPAHIRNGNALDPSDYEAQGEYYRYAGQFLYEHKFTSKQDRAIWELHAEGVPYRETADRLGVTVRLVMDTVQRLRGKMGVRDVREIRGGDDKLILETLRYPADFDTLLLYAIAKRGG